MAETDTTMTDAPGESAEQPSSAQVVDSIEVEPTVKTEDAAEAGSDAGDDDAQDDGGDGRPVSNKQYKALKNITEVLTEFKIEKGNQDYYPSMLFKRVPNKRNLPDYYQIISEPSAISTLKGKIQRKSYTGIPEFVRDFALIVHNAQVYNRPNSQPVRDVFQLDTVFKAEIQKLVEQGMVKEEDTVFPDLGEIPAATPEPDPVSEEEEEEVEEDGEGEGEEDEDEDDGDDSDDARRKRRRGRPSAPGRKGRDDDDEGKDGDSRKRRGRPPKVDTPMEARIKAVIKGLRKPKDTKGLFRLRHFERLPDKAEYPHYYQEIKEPIAMDTIKKKSKRKKYNSLEHFMKDIELMFRNAMAYNLDSSEIYQDAKVLLDEASDLATAEKNKPDEEYLLDDGRVPLPDGIEYKGEIWKIGDWIHIQNPNDVTKPVIAQIYRTWRDGEGQNWINACWYYRPEQTVHQYEKHFFPNEVVKTGQYRDHHIEEVIDRCFVMFFTRYNRGRPRNLDPSKEVYVCEARYNEEKHKFNKIKTWASCLPDEVRDKDYEMDLFDAPRKIKKVPSPLKHLLKEDAKDNEEIPTPQWGNKNAPPIVGGIYKGPRDENQSPPPEPTPPPPPTPIPAPVRAPSNTMLPLQQNRAGFESASASTPHIQPQMVRPTPSITPQPSSYHAASASPAQQYPRQPSFPQVAPVPYQNSTAQTPAQSQPAPFVAQQHPPPAYSATPSQGYGGVTPSQGYGRATIQQAQAQAYQSYQGSNVHEQRATEAYVLSDTANESIPKDIRDQFPQDDQGRVLFFTRPPIDTRHIVSGRTEGEKGRPLIHTESYLEAKAARQKALAQQKRRAEETNGDVGLANGSKRVKSGFFGEERDSDGRIKVNSVNASQAQAQSDLDRAEKAKQQQASEQAFQLQTRAIKMIANGMVNGTVKEYLATYGDRALQYFERDHARAKLRLEDEQQRRLFIEETEQPSIEADTRRLLSQNFWTGRARNGTGRFEDDFDNRLPR